VTRFDDKLFNDRGLDSEIRGLDKIIKLTNNTAIRLSAQFNKENQEKLNVVVNILSDANHYLERIQKMYNYGLRFKFKQRKLTNLQVQTLSDMWASIASTSSEINALIDNSVNNNLVVDDTMFNQILAHAQCNDEKNAKARKSVFVPQQKINGDYGTYFDVLLAFENINTDLYNITIKIGILSN